MTVQHQVRLRIDDVETDAIAARISMDSTMAPRTTGEVIVPASAVPADLDPRYFVQWVDVEAEAMTKHELCLRDFPWGIPDPELYPYSSFELPSGTVTVRTNLYRYPNAETGTTTGWGAYLSAAITSSTDQAHSGSRSYKVVTTGSVVSEGLLASAVSNTISSGVAGQETHSVWVFAPLGSTLELVLEEMTPANAFVASRGISNFTGTGAWQRVYITGNKSTATNVLRVVVRTRASAQAITFYVDDLLGEVGSTLNDYFDGNTPDAGDFEYLATGTENNSTSIMRAKGLLGVSDSGVYQSQEWAAEGTYSAFVPAGKTLTVALAEPSTVKVVARNTGQTMTVGGNAVTSTAAGEQLVADGGTAAVLGPGYWDLLSVKATKLADLSTLFAGKQLRDFPYTDVTRSWRLHVRRVDEDFAGDTITLGLASAEAILQDFANPGGIQAGGGWVVDWEVTLPTTSILAAINKVLEVCALPAITVYPSAAASTSVDEALRSWVRGVTAWEKVLQLARSINAFPVPDDVTGGLELRSGSNPAPITLHDLYSYGPSRRLKGGSITRDRGASDFAVAVVPVAQLIPAGDTQARPLGASQKSAGSLGYAGPRPWRTKVTGVTASGAAPSYVVPSSSGIANAQAFEATGRGDTADLVIPIDLQINLKDPIDVYRPARTKQRYRVEGLTYQWPADELTISGRPYVSGGANLVQLTDWWIP